MKTLLTFSPLGPEGPLSPYKIAQNGNSTIANVDWIEEGLTSHQTHRSYVNEF